jgi:hypothetical protein
VVIQLVELAQVLGVGDVAEGLQMAHHQHAPMPGIIGDLALQASRRRAIEQMDYHHHRLPPILGR